MEKQFVSNASTNAGKKNEFLSMIKNAAGLNSSSSDTGKGRSKSSSNRVSHGFHLVEGKSGHDMEDYHVAVYKNIKNHELGLFAIFDGHLGDRVPSYLKDNLFKNILEEPNFWKDTEKAIKSAYCATDKFILENATRLGPGGSTAVTAIVIDGKDFWVANIGDSRAVLCERGSANQLTVDHEPHNERIRIEKQGGFVTILPGDVPRVNGQLAVARAFGDQSLKAHLSSEPDIRHVPIDSTIEFVILASDGLWKVMKNQEAVDLVKSVKDPQAAAKRLTMEALARKSRDDISCIVIRFGS
ncbi:probable protein phosphatase 2C 44 [Macadamia integrifolia]|uniref:probable protein phosphatase 2C 44 n=1 Tax=Macadamia integrifolia TaxID=60698 RepID=UPI001C501C6A|nr:probable protein phosphatase 2C 44 [Macadamia integrifolia]XP_042502388.1 probable protein phosphatase 2C 44 [Macadamia integrifolia]XP_042502389.1 probable protein phosphatase 2C 44 [Macadamia integrifolia]